ncbi:MAG: ferrous iron transport protein B [Betaproteobacteria bacterium HGW-Betaproteobacteria-11]|nr:MAG: ferrous iron transport protein B [Betaproteobacteria bacterium HGW-Betaproteobacteria-11]
MNASIALVGQPNVGKSVIFHRLTGRYVNVANYPGTTIEVSRGLSRAQPGVEVLDTPGVLTLPARSEDEQATARILLNEKLRALVQVGDAKNLRRTVQLALLLAEAGVPMVLALNMMDEAKARGMAFDPARLAVELGLAVVPTVATGNEGMTALARAIADARVPVFRLTYADPIEAAIDDLALLLPIAHLSPRVVALLYLAGDRATEEWLAAQGTDLFALAARRERLQDEFTEPLAEVLQRARITAAEAIVHRVVKDAGSVGHGFVQRLGQWSVHRTWGWPLLALVLYGVYAFVGQFGAKYLVDLLEKQLFEGVINPWFHALVTTWIPWHWLQDFLVGPYGLWTMGMTYALALILPIVTTFFIAFGILEDSGYFARLSVLSNRAFKTLGLNGRAVLPMVLGLGCVTMATLTTRILHTPRERLIVTFLLALAIPCSAQLGVVMGMLASYGTGAFLIWLGVVIGVLFTVGWLSGKLVKGKRIPLMTELPPMRLPVAGNVAKKTWSRLKWYLEEVIPLFLIGAALMFVLDRLGFLPWLIQAGEPLVTGWLGLPKEASAALLMGFLRRDFGATGLFALGSALSPEQGLVGLVTLTIFVPCIASTLMIIKEQGLKTAAIMTGLIIPLAFLIGGLLHRALLFVGFA